MRKGVLNRVKRQRLIENVLDCKGFASFDYLIALNTDQNQKAL
jgi:hypothetical protein